MLQALRKALRNPTAQWSCEGQRLAVHAGLDNKTDVVAVLPTGAGKSAIVTTLSFLEPGSITVVLCPLKSLIFDWRRRLSELKHKYEVFNPQTPKLTGQCPIVLASLDQSVSHAFSQAIKTLPLGISLRRYVIDEAHLIITESSYRSVMQLVPELRTVPAQMMVLSATLPPTSVPTLKERCLLMENTTVVRASSNRPELYFKPVVELTQLDQWVSVLVSFRFSRVSV